MPPKYQTFSSRDKNQQTFGSEVSSERFDFSSSSKSFEKLRGKEKTNYKELTAEELELAIIRPPNPGLSVSEIEAKLKKNIIEEDEDVPPGFALTPASLRIPTSQIPDREVVITFPHANPIGDQEGDELHSLMTDYEIELIKRIHCSQLTTAKPEVEDWYYQEYAERVSHKHDTTHMPLYFPLPHKSTSEAKKTKERKKPQEEQQTVRKALEGVLGKISKSSSRKPRQQMERLSAQQSAPILSGTTQDELDHQVLLKIENGLSEVLRMDSQGEEKETIAEQLMLDCTTALDGAQMYQFVQIMNHEKGRLFVGRAVRYLRQEHRSLLFQRLVASLEYLEAFRSSDHGLAESLIRHVWSSLVTHHVGEMSWDEAQSLLADFLAKKAFLWIAHNPGGLVLLCILMSRLEILKQDGHEDELEQISCKVYQAIHQNIEDFFAGGPMSSFYVWQLMALLALNVDSAIKKNLVLELRDRIMGIVESPTANSRELENINVFLNALGLDISQLS